MVLTVKSIARHFSQRFSYGPAEGAREIAMLVAGGHFD
jgi:hypothetical protein